MPPVYTERDVKLIAILEELRGGVPEEVVIRLPLLEEYLAACRESQLFVGKVLDIKLDWSAQATTRSLFYDGGGQTASLEVVKSCLVAGHQVMKVRAKGPGLAALQLHWLPTGPGRGIHYYQDVERFLKTGAKQEMLRGLPYKGEQGEKIGQIIERVLSQGNMRVPRRSARRALSTLQTTLQVRKETRLRYTKTESAPAPDPVQVPAQTVEPVPPVQEQLQACYVCTRSFWEVQQEELELMCLPCGHLICCVCLPNLPDQCGLCNRSTHDAAPGPRVVFYSAYYVPHN